MKVVTKYLREYKLLLVVGPAFKLFEAILELFLPYLMSLAIDNGVLANDKSYVMKIGLIMVCTATVGVVSALICQYTASIVSQGFGTKLRNAMYSKITSFSSNELDDFGTASLVNRITNDVNQLQVAVAMLIRLVIRAPFLCIGGFIMALFLDVKLSMVLVVVLPMFIIVLAITMLRTVPLYKSVQKKLDKMAIVVRENLSGVRVIRAFSRVKFEQDKYEQSNDEYMKAAIKVGRLSALLNPLTTLIMNLSICAILWFGGMRVSNSKLDVGTIIAFNTYMIQILAALIIVSNLVVLYTKAFASLGRIKEVLNTEVSIVEGSKEVEDGLNAKNFVEFKNVCLKYSESGEPALENISFSVKKGETVGIIGPTGSGKSTLVNLIQRTYDVTSGNVLIDGIDVKEYTTNAITSLVGIVPQKTVLFTGTIEENLKWGNQNATDEEIMLASSIAQASEFIEKMPQKYDTNISQGGVNVSGGQRQRLTIARALVKKAPILILDDSFSALDFVTDSNLRKGLRKYCSEVTTFIISQRVSTIKSSDKIIVLNDGEMVGIGSHDQLMESCEIYKEIYLTQTDSQEGESA